MLIKETVFCIVCGARANCWCGHLHDPCCPEGILRDRDPDFIMAGFCGDRDGCVNINWNAIASLSKLVRLMWNGSICKNTGCHGWWGTGYGLQIRDTLSNSVTIRLPTVSTTTAEGRSEDVR